MTNPYCKKMVVRKPIKDSGWTSRITIFEWRDFFLATCEKKLSWKTSLKHWGFVGFSLPICLFHFRDTTAAKTLTMAICTMSALICSMQINDPAAIPPIREWLILLVDCEEIWPPVISNHTKWCNKNPLQITRNADPTTFLKASTVSYVHP